MIAVASFTTISLLIALSYWKEERYLLIGSGLGLFIYGCYFVSSLTYLGIIVVLFGIYTIARGLGFRS
jgi:hypothetical protein